MATVYYDEGTQKIEIENAQLMFKNFSGTEKRNNGKIINRAGSRNFCVMLDEDSADKLKMDGWNVKLTRPRDEEDEGRPYIQVKINYDTEFEGLKPKIFMIDRKKTLLNPRTIGELDFAEIENVDLSINPNHYEVDGRSGISAYVGKMYVKIASDRFSDKYSDFDDDEDEIPFGE